MSKTSTLARKLASLATVTALVIAGAVVGIAAAPVAAADPGPVVPPSAGTASTDALPTVQIEAETITNADNTTSKIGLAWSQVVVGNTVYVTGNFAHVRPAGAAPGVNTVARSNILAYDITTGVLNTTFAPTLNGQGLVIAASPDGKVIYVGGMFTQANGVNKYRLAAFRPDGTLITGWSPDVSFTVKTIVATNSTVYVGGAFTLARSQPRNRLAAFTAANPVVGTPATGALLSWAPSADAQVNAMVLTPDGSRLIVGGSFQNVNGSPAYGLASISTPGSPADPTNPNGGSLLPWAAGNSVKDAGPNSAIMSLSTDGTAIYGSGYHFGTGGNLEGIFSADPNSGTINWLEDCHGDTYSTFPVNGTVYGVNHAHYCGNVGGFPQSDNWSVNGRNAIAFTTNATGTLLHDPHGYFDWYGTPSPSMINWYPELTQGTVTTSGQAAWNITGNSQYVVLGGEFPAVNGIAQQGLVRFAVKSIAPLKDGPRLSGANFVPAITPTTPGKLHITWQANHDRDDMTLSYKLVRDNNTAAPIYSATVDSTFWNRPAMGFDDTVTPGVTYKYRLYATDPAGNQVAGDNVTITAPTADGVSAYGKKVIADGADTYWPLNEATGNTQAIDYAHYNNGDAGTGITRGAAGAITGDTASTFNGTSTGVISTRHPIAGPNTFTVSAWFNTTSTKGGKIIGFGQEQTLLSGSYDRHIYMGADGKVRFGVHPGVNRLIESTATYNDGQWHQVVGSVGPGGMKFYIDGKLIGQRTDTTSGEAYTGYWRVGGDNTSGWVGAPTNNYFTGSIDDVAFFSNQLTTQQVLAEYTASGRAAAVVPAPADAYGAAVYNDDPDLYYRLAETTGTVAADSSPYANTGDYFGTVTKNVTGAVTGNAAATFNPANQTTGVVASRLQALNPTLYTEEAWIKTTTTRGGNIVGLGNARSTNSTATDRHLYMQNDGRVVFGVNPGTVVELTSPTALNNGQWHHLVASQSASGMKLYVDGALVASNAQAGAGNYVGWWKVGGDVTGNSTSNYLNGSIDEVAVYTKELSAQQVANHYGLGAGQPVNQLPVASFTVSNTNLTTTVNGSASADPDGTVASYAWTFGDGGTATGATPAAHTYATAGTYPVTLTVTDNAGGIGTTTSQVTVAGVNQAPVASFTSSAADLALTVNGSASSDPDGTIAGYSWNFGDSTAAVTGATPAAHVYAAGGSYTVTLTVTDDKGATNQKAQLITVTAPNQAPTAAFTVTSAGLAVTVDGSTSTDPDGTISATTGYAWDFGDGGTATGVKPAAHTYATAGAKTVKLTVTDNDGATNTKTTSVTVAAGNVSPTASFTATPTNLSVALNASGSSDPDGTIAGYAWTFSDGGSATGVTASHDFATAGTYDVTLTVTDNGGAATVKTQSVTVTAAVQTLLAQDLFARTVTGGFGTATTGGLWTVSGMAAAQFSVAPGTGSMTMPTAGLAPAASLNSLTIADSDSTVDFSMNKEATGGGAFISIGARKVGTSEYRARAKLVAGGLVQLSVTKKVGSLETAILTKTVTGMTFTPGTALRMRLQVSGTSTVTLKANLWPVGGTEPSTWFVTGTDSTSPLAQGSPVLNGYTTATSTNAPVTVTFSNFSVGSIAAP